MTDNEYFIFTHQTHATMWSVEETTLNPRTHLKGEDGVWMYFISPDETKIYAVRRSLHQTEKAAEDEAYFAASINIEMNGKATIHHMTDPYKGEQL